ncbi:protein ripply1 [Heptranchias perlo]|uniref:protein ripply1 n=1 Tax=Heptranchias perlo TaxID=212740 RepID=UPI00355AA231
MEVAVLSVQSHHYNLLQNIRLTQTQQICENPASSSSLWRPWVMTARDIERQRWRWQNSPHMGRANDETAGWTIPSLFTHPVRLMWPRSKCFDYLYSEGQELLAAFPVQATISFYIESDSEDEDAEFDEEDELEEDSATEESVLEKKTGQKSLQL